MVDGGSTLNVTIEQQPSGMPIGMQHNPNSKIVKDAVDR